MHHMEAVLPAFHKNKKCHQVEENFNIAHRITHPGFGHETLGAVTVLLVHILC